MHRQVRREAIGGSVDIDAEMVPLFDALTEAGVVTVGSCIDLAGATARLWPEKLADLTAPVQPRVNYRRVITSGLAFVRLIDAPAASPFLAAVQRSGGEVLVSRTSPAVAQAAFQRWQVASLADAC